jgi:RNA polymerase sigma-70 factor (ECF subfamily)
MRMLLEPRQAVFESAVRTHIDDLFRYAYWLSRNRWRAEDLVQETLVRAWGGWAGLREPQAVKSWLFTILYHEFARDAARSRNLQEEQAAANEPYADDDPSLGLDMAKALEQLNAESRDALLLQVLGGFSCAEIARVLGSSEGAVMTRLSRARQALRRALEPEGFDKEAREG